MNVVIGVGWRWSVDVVITTNEILAEEDLNLDPEQQQLQAASLCNNYNDGDDDADDVV